MSTMKSILVILLFSQISFAQTLGNPGGGGPDDEMGNESIQCKSHFGTLRELETSFLDIWHKKFISFADFGDQVEEIKNQIIIDSITDILKLNSLQSHICKDINTEKQAIYAILKELEGSIAVSCHANPNIRTAHIDSLKSLLEIYEKK
jgi:hypothetical protein